MIRLRQASSVIRRDGIYIVAVLFVLVALLGNVIQPAARPEIELQEEREQEAVDLGLNELAFGVTLVTAVTYAGVVCLVCCMVKMARKQALVPAESLRRAEWCAWDVVKAAALYFAVLMLALWLGRVVEAQALGLPAQARGPLANLASEFAARVALVAAVFHAASAHRGGFRALGVERANWRKGLRTGGAAYLAFLPVYLGLVRLQTWLAGAAGLTPPRQEAVRIAQMTNSVCLLVAVSVFAAIVAPLTEELYFRGFMQSAMRKRLRGREAIMVSALIFAYVHQNWFALIPLFGLGLLLGYLYERTQSLVAPVTVHVLHNLAMLAVIFWFRSLGSRLAPACGDLSGLLGSSWPLVVMHL